MLLYYHSRMALSILLQYYFHFYPIARREKPPRLTAGRRWDIILVQGECHQAVCPKRFTKKVIARLEVGRLLFFVPCENHHKGQNQRSIRDQYGTVLKQAFVCYHANHLLPAQTNAERRQTARCFWQFPKCTNSQPQYITYSGRKQQKTPKRTNPPGVFQCPLLIPQ